MATGDILNKYGTAASYGITLDTGLANNDGQIGPKIDNSTNGYTSIRITGNVTPSGTATAGNRLDIYLLSQDLVTTPNVVTEDYTIADAATTTQPEHIIPVYSMIVPDSPAADEALHFDFVIHEVPIAWGLLFWNAVGVGVKATGSEVYYVGQYKQVSA